MSDMRFIDFLPKILYTDFVVYGYPRTVTECLAGFNKEKSEILLRSRRREGLIHSLNMSLNLYSGRRDCLDLSRKTCPKTVQRAAMHSVRTKRYTLNSGCTFAVLSEA